MAGGPGIGIQLRHGKHAGRILIPFNEGPFGVWNIYAVYSDDKGKTRTIGDVAPRSALIPTNISVSARKCYATTRKQISGSSPLNSPLHE